MKGGQAVYYDLWDLKSRNQLETFQTEAEALAAVREILAINPPELADSLSLGYADEDGRGGLIAEGALLAIRAHEAAGDGTARPAGGARRKRRA